LESERRKKKNFRDVVTAWHLFQEQLRAIIGGHCFSFSFRSFSMPEFVPVAQSEVKVFRKNMMKMPADLHRLRKTTSLWLNLFN
jgi:hypothetical protein